MKTATLIAALIAVGTLATAFMAGLLTGFHPEEHGLIHRMMTFGWRYGLAAGVTAAALFLIIYREQIFRR